MPEVTVRQYADVIGVSVDRLLEQLEQAGLAEKSADDMISDNEKSELLGFLRKKRGKDDSAEPRKITLKRKSLSEIKVPVAGAGRIKPRAKTVSVEFRRRRTYAKRSAIEEEAARQAAEREQREAEEAAARDAERAAAAALGESVPAVATGGVPVVVALPTGAAAEARAGVATNDVQPLSTEAAPVSAPQSADAAAEDRA
ncbi:MAG: translation initiation factor IF-2 associated domain-containing protein, partial [Gammaproteobacteria bacterium]